MNHEYTPRKSTLTLPHSHKPSTKNNSSKIIGDAKKFFLEQPELKEYHVEVKSGENSTVVRFVR